MIASHLVINDARERPESGPTNLPEFVSLAVHELRTPVTVVAGYLRMLLREHAGPLSDRQRKMIEEADRSCARIGSLVAEMSELGKLEARELGLARTDFDLAALVAEAAAAMPENDRGVRIEVRGSDRPLLASGDSGRIAIALKALLHSAVRERGEPGVVVAECNMVDTWGVVTIGDDALLPALRDVAGAAPAGFDEWRGGMGLSLPVARRVLEAHGGALWSARDGSSRAACGLRLPLASPRS